MEITNLVSANAELCRSCKTCEMACSISHFGECNSTRSRIRAIRTLEDGSFYAAPAVCQQCEDPICQAVCPVKAIYRSSETGAKLVDADKCLGCRRCVYSCPFGGCTVDVETKVSTKCDLCEGEPNCVKFCPYGALEYVRADKLDLNRKRKAIQTVLDSQITASHANK
jgi:carbon-monoxide dehydrogenase iron sulfur subunit